MLYVSFIFNLIALIIFSPVDFIALILSLVSMHEAEYIQIFSEQLFINSSVGLTVTAKI